MTYSIESALERIKNNLPLISVRIAELNQNTDTKHKENRDAEVLTLEKILNFDFEAFDVNTLDRRKRSGGAHGANMVCGRALDYNFADIAAVFMFGRRGVCAS